MKRHPSPTRSGNLREVAGGSFIALASIQFGAVVVLGKLLADRHVAVPAMLAVRFALAGTLLAAALSLSRKRLAAAPGEGWRLVLLGGIAYASESALFFFALRHGTAAAITLLFFSYPVWVALLSAAMGGGVPGRPVVVSLVLTLLGAALVVASSGGLDIRPAGVILALSSAVTFSFYLVGADRVVRETSSPAAAMWVSLSAAGGLALFAVMSGQARAPSGAAEWFPVSGMGVLTAGAFFCLFAGLRRVGAVRTAIIASLEPVATALLALIFLGEPLGAGVVAGGALILAGAVIASIARRELTKLEAPGP
ncbi:MAG: DMT family transporter [Actinomycetota bacterium]